MRRRLRPESKPAHRGGIDHGPRMTSQSHILVVENDAFMRQLIERVLAREDYRLSFASDAEQMSRVLDRGGVDIILLDIGLPGEDGLSIARRLRADCDIGIVMVTGRDEPVDKVVGLEVGADDYVTKPFDDRELLARVRSLLRRLRARADGAPPSPGRVAEFLGWTLNLDAGELVGGDGRTVHLTAAEFHLLEALVTRAGRVLSRDQLAEKVATRDWTPFDRSIDVLVSKLRKKIEADPKRPTLIKSVRGLGYKFTADVRLRD